MPAAKGGAAALAVVPRAVPAQALVKMPTPTLLMSLLADAASMLKTAFEPFTVNLLNSWNPGDWPLVRA